MRVWSVCFYLDKENQENQENQAQMIDTSDLPGISHNLNIQAKNRTILNLQ